MLWHGAAVWVVDRLGRVVFLSWRKCRAVRLARLVQYFWYVPPYLQVRETPAVVLIREQLSKELTPLRKIESCYGLGLKIYSLAEARRVHGLG